MCFYIPVPFFSFFFSTGYRFSYGKSSLSAINYKLLKNFLASGIDAPYTLNAYDEAIQWAHDVKNSAFADADSINDGLVGTSVPGAMALCSQAFQVGAVCHRLHKRGKIRYVVHLRTFSPMNLEKMDHPKSQRGQPNR